MQISDEESWDTHENRTRKREARLEKPTPVDREIIISKDKVLLSITDSLGVIEYCNEDFVEVSGYEEYELAGSPHNIIRHPDMPRVIFKLMWERLQNNHNIVAIVKNLSKTGRYYWVMTDFVVKEDRNGCIIGYKASRRAAPKKSIEVIIPLYKKLRELENVQGMEASEKFLNGFLDAEDTTYDDFIESLVNKNIEPEIDIVSEGEEVKDKILSGEVLRDEDVVRGEVLKTVTEYEKKSLFKRLFRL